MNMRVTILPVSFMFTKPVLGKSIVPLPSVGKAPLKFHLPMTSDAHASVN